MAIYSIDVLSISWGYYYETMLPLFWWTLPILDAMVNTLVNMGLPVVCAAGNWNYEPEHYTQNVVIPATAERAITVGASYDDNSRAQFSAIGNLDYIKPDVLAPGVSIHAPAADNQFDPEATHDRYQVVDGTSFSAPFVAGLIGLMLESQAMRGNEGDGNPRIKHLLMASAEELPDDESPGKDNVNGAGFVDALNVWNFWHNDVSSSKYNAKSTITTMGWQDQPWDRDNEPMWVYDGEDWYWLMCYAGKFIYAAVRGDPDFIGRVYLFDSALNELGHSTYANRNPSIWIECPENGLYYIKVIPENFSGDYYDIHILTTLS